MSNRRTVLIETLVLLALWLGLMVLGRSQLFRDPGTFWHTALGEQILRQQEPVRYDPFSFTRPGAPYVDYEWLAELGMGVLYRLGGWDALLAATAFLLAWVYSRCFGRLLRAGLHPLAAGVLLGLALAASSQQFHVRPLVLSLALLAWTFALLVDVEAGRAAPRRLLWLLPVFVLWANAHGGVLAGIGTVGLTCAGWMAVAAWPRWAARLGVQQAPGLRWALLAVVASVLAVLVNPFGLEMPRVWLEILALPLPNIIQEHAPLDFRQPYAWCTLALAGIYLAVLSGTAGRRLRVVWLLPVVWLVLAAMRVRNAPLMALSMLIALADVLPHCRWSTWLAARGYWLPAIRGPDRDDPPGHSRESLATPGAVLCHARDDRAVRAICSIVMLGLLAGILVLQAAGVQTPLGRGWVRWDEARWPTDLAPQLSGLPGGNPADAKIFNDMRLGGFVIFHAPQLKIFIDDRCDFYGRQRLLDYEEARTEHPERIEAWRRRYGFCRALVLPGTPFDTWLQTAEGWTCVGRCASGVLYGYGAESARSSEY